MDPREVLEISAKATPGPWIIKREDLGDESTCVAPIEIIGANNFYVVSNEGGLASMVHEWSVEELEANANLITLARTALPELAQEVIRLREKYESPGVKCNKGHVNNLPLALWDCPMCTEELRVKNTQLRAERDAAVERLQQTDKALELACDFIWQYAPNLACEPVRDVAYWLHKAKEAGK